MGWKSCVLRKHKRSMTILKYEIEARVTRKVCWVMMSSRDTSVQLWQRGRKNLQRRYGVGGNWLVFNCQFSIAEQKRMEGWVNKEPRSTDHYSRNDGVVEQQLLMKIITILGWLMQIGIKVTWEIYSIEPVWGRQSLSLRQGDLTAMMMGSIGSLIVLTSTINAITRHPIAWNVCWRVLDNRLAVYAA